MMEIKVKYSGALALPAMDEAQRMCNWLRHFADNLPAGYKLGDKVPCAIPPEQVRALICGLETHMRAEQESGRSPAFDVQEEMPLKHLFSPHTYTRQITIKKDRWVIGKIHKHSHPNFLMQGRVVVLTEDGLMVMEAPFSFISRPGAKRLVLALEDTVWATSHITDETDLDKIEQEVIAKTYADVPGIEHEKVKELL